jgi:hypothetical protein
MNKKILGIFVSFLIFIPTTQAISQTITTNADGVVLKNIECVLFGSTLRFTLVNRNNVAAGSKKLYGKSYDSDGDPVASSWTYMVDAGNGRSAELKLKCGEGITHQFIVR